MTQLAAEGIVVALTCRVLKLCRQQYYRWLAEPVTQAEWDQARRANALFEAHRDDPEFGYRYLTRRSPRCRREHVGQDGVETVLGQRVVVELW